MNFKLSKILKQTFLLLAIGVFITSCSKEDIAPVAPEVDQNLIDDIKNRNDLGVFLLDSTDCDCFGPFGDIDWENDDPEVIEAQITAALDNYTEEELEALFTPVCTDDGSFYPNACFAECEGVTIYGPCEEGDYGCDIDDWDVVDCYTLVYPVTINYADGSTFTVNSEEEFFDLLFSNDQEPQFVYPFDVINELGEVVTINNDDDWADSTVNCFGGGWGDPNGPDEPWDCFEIQYPVTLEFGDGSTITANDPQEEIDAIITYLESLGMDQFPMITYQFPLSVSFPTVDVVVTVNSEEELALAVEEHCD